MSVVSDPGLHVAPRLHGSPGDPGSRPPVREVGAPPAPRSSRSRIAVYVTLTAATIALGLRGLATLLAIPLEPPPVGGIAPTWMIEVTTTSATPTTALLYGRDVGVQLVRVPARRGSADEPRLVPARLAKGELHLISLGLASLHVHASAPQGAQPMKFDATSPIITAFHHPRAIGVRTGW